MPIIEREALRKLLDDALSVSVTFKHIEGVNPCRISFDGAEYFVYIKNLSPAQLSNNNPDIWRIQLPIRDPFQDIKESPLPFILLGYDGENDIYTTWNPHWAKQRLNVAKSVSFYSRLSVQENARIENQFQRQELNNDGEVLAFPREKIPYYLINMGQFFPDMSEYVAMGSRKRTEANEAYKLFSDAKNIADFAHYLALDGLMDRTINNYCRAIRTLINEGYISRNRKIFLACDSIAEYSQTIKQFITIPEITAINEVWHGTYSAALGKYLSYIMEISSENSEEVVIQEKTEEEFENIDWEAEFTNEQGKLTRIANPELIDKLRPYLDTDYRSLSCAYNIVADFYSDRYHSPIMELRDWQKLFDQIDWSNPYYTPKTHDANSDGEQEGKRKTHILRVTFPDGSIVQEKKVSDTLVKVVKYAGADCVKNLNINTCGENMIVAAPNINPLYSKATKYIGNNLYVNTCSDTQTKYNVINKISKDLNLNLLVDFVSVTSNEVVEINPATSTRAKIKVTFPDGRVIQYAKVLDTLIEVMLYAGVENVRKLDIRINNDNLITNEVTPTYEVSLKPLGNGAFVHTNSVTETKLEQIQRISDDLNLDLIVELVYAYSGRN